MMAGVSGVASGVVRGDAVTLNLLTRLDRGERVKDIYITMFIFASSVYIVSYIYTLYF